MIVVGPKGLLRAPFCQSKISELAPGTKFVKVLDDPLFDTDAKRSNVEKICFLSGKLYYDLVNERASRKLDDKVALIRLEELNPFPKQDLLNILSMYPNIKGILPIKIDYVWVQEEPQNQGAYTFVEPRLEHLIPKEVAFDLCSCATTAGELVRHLRQEYQRYTKRSRSM